MSGASIGINHSAFESSEIGGIITPDVLTPGQYADERRITEHSPERALYYSVLEDAINHWLKGGPAQTRKLERVLALEAEHWIWNECGTVTFEMCCEVCGFLPEWLRSKLESVRPRRPMKMSLIRHQVTGGKFPLPGFVQADKETA